MNASKIKTLIRSYLTVRNITIALIWIIIGQLLFWTSRSNYLLFHSTAETFSIVIAFAIFILAWNSRRFIGNNYLLFIGITYFFIAILDFLHTFSYTGMNIFSGESTNTSTQLWIAARYMQALSLLLAPLFTKRSLKPILTIGTYIVLNALIIASIFYWQIFPAAYSNGGLTTFKVVSEYIISVILIIAAVAINRQKADFSSKTLNLIVWSIVVTIASEMAFTLYSDVYGFLNFLGHFLKIIAFYLIYKALVENGLKNPFELLFLDLKRREETLDKQKTELTELNSALLQEVEIRESAEKLAQKKEREYKNLFTRMTEAFALHEIILDEAGTPCNYRFIEVNDAFTEFTGLRDVEGRTIQEVMPDIEIEWIETYGKVAITGDSVRFENYNSSLGKWFDVYAYSPQKMQFVTLFRDVTDEKKIREEINKLSKFPSENPYPVMRISHDGTVIYANESSMPILNHWDCGIGQRLPATYMQFARVVLDTDTGQLMELYIAERVYSLYFTPIKEMDYVNVYGIDITELKRIEIALRKSQESLERAQAIALIGNWQIDVKTEKITWSEETYRIFDIPEGTPITMESFIERVYEEDQERVLDEWRSALLGGGYDLEYRIVTGDAMKWVRASAIIESDINGIPVTGIGTIQDITDIKEVEQMKDEFVGLVSHELRTPLTIIIGSLKSAMTEGISEEDKTDLIENAIDGALSLSEILENLIELSRYQADRLRLELKAVGIRDVADKVLKKLAELHVKQPIVLEIPDNLPDVKADAIRVERVLFNLIENATKYSPESSTITVSSGVDNGFVVTSVIDQGSGISPEDQLKLFEQFQRLSEETKGKTGAGLGLVVCRRLIEAQEGWIEVSSDLGKGSVFSFGLPEYNDN